MSELIEARKLKGFRDHAPEQALLRKSIIDRVWQTATLAGFQPIVTPALEYATTLVGAGGGDSDKEVYRFMDHGEREVALRFDLTVPFARYVAENQGTLIFPFKKLQIGDVWRGEKPQKGRYREFCQADVDIVGVDSMAADLEVICCLSTVLTQFPTMHFTITFGHRVLLSALIKKVLGPPGETHEALVITTIDKLAKIGPQGVTTMLTQLSGIDPDKALKLLSIITARTAAGEADLALAREAIGDDAFVQEHVTRYDETIRILRGLSRPNLRFVADLSLARGLGYYTGIVFEATVDGLAGFGSVSGGGRYNQLVSRFSAQELPGVGGSIGVDRFLAAIEELGGIGAGVGPRHVYIAVAGEDARAYAIGMAEELRHNGFVCDLGLKPGKLANQFRQADRLGYALVAVVGSNEVAEQSLSLKTLASGAEDKGLRRSDLLTAVQERLPKPVAL